MHSHTDLVAYAAAGVSFAAAAITPSGLEIANEVATLIGTIVGTLSGVASLIYFVWKWKNRK